LTEPLTDRERQVLGLLADGLKPAAIARRLEVTERTVGRTTRSLLTKLGAATPAQAVAIACRRGLGDLWPSVPRGYQPALVKTWAKTKGLT
jgi:DNA-binding NarL/FixJ family response regulator